MSFIFLTYFITVCRQILMGLQIDSKSFFEKCHFPWHTKIWMKNLLLWVKIINCRFFRWKIAFQTKEICILAIGIRVTFVGDDRSQHWRFQPQIIFMHSRETVLNFWNSRGFSNYTDASEAVIYCPKNEQYLQGPTTEQYFWSKMQNLIEISRISKFLSLIHLMIFHREANFDLQFVNPFNFSPSYQRAMLSSSISLTWLSSVERKI